MMSLDNQASKVNSGMECRICHSKTTQDLIISPCLCKGSLGFVHIQCLEEWLNFSSQTFCELCSYKFKVIQVRRYSFWQSIGTWLCRDRSSVYKALLFVVLSGVNSTLLSWLWFLWISNIPYTFFTSSFEFEDGVTKEKENQISKTKWIIVFVFLTLLTVFSVKSLCCDTYKVVKMQYHAWHRWRNESVNVRLILDLKNYKINVKMGELDPHEIKHTSDQPEEEFNLEEVKMPESEGKILAEASCSDEECKKVDSSNVYCAVQIEKK